MSNRSIGGYLAGFVSILLIKKLSQPKAPSKRDDDGASQCYYIADNDREPLHVQIINDGWHAEEKKHREEEKDYWRKSRLYNVIAIAIATLAFGAAGGAFWQALRQANSAATQTAIAHQTLVEESRPWLVVGATIKPIDLEVQNPIFYLSAEINVTNVGHSPAQAVSISAKITEGGIFPPSDLTQKACADAKDKRSTFIKLPTDVIFPTNEENRRSFVAPANINQFIIDNFAASERDFRNFVEPILKRKHVEFKRIPEDIKTHRPESFLVIGCVVYISFIDGLKTIHGTGFAFSVMKTENKQKKDNYTGFELRRDGHIAGTDLAFTRFPTNSFAD